MSDINIQELKQTTGEAALAWVTRHNAISTSRLQSDPSFASNYKKILDILESKAKIPAPQIQGNYIYNFWQDDVHIRGILRRTLLTEYCQPEPTWELVLDIDALAKKRR